MRIVSLVPSITEALCMLGLEDELIAVTDYCLHPADVVACKRRVGGTKNPRLGDICGLRPDLVIVNTDENRRQTFDQLQDAGLSVLVTETDSLDQVEQAWTQLGDATGRAALASSHRGRIAATRAFNRAALRQVEPVPTLIPVWRDPWMASGAGTYMESLLDECGFRNIMSHAASKWIRLDLQRSGRAGTYTLPELPQLILLPTEPYRFSDADRDDFVQLGAPRERVHVVDGVLLSWWLSRTAAALEFFRQLRLSLPATAARHAASAPEAHR